MSKSLGVGLKDRSQDEWKELVSQRLREMRLLDEEVKQLRNRASQLEDFEREVLGSRKTIEVLKQILIELKTKTAV